MFKHYQPVSITHHQPLLISLKRYQTFLSIILKHVVRITNHYKSWLTMTHHYNHHQDRPQRNNESHLEDQSTKLPPWDRKIASALEDAPVVEPISWQPNPSGSDVVGDGKVPQYPKKPADALEGLPAFLYGHVSRTRSKYQMEPISQESKQQSICKRKAFRIFQMSVIPG